MNKSFKYIGLLIGIVSLLVFNACDDNIDPVIEELEFDRVFTPLELSTQISNQTTVSISWGFNKGIDSYDLEISDDSLQYSNIIHTVNVSPDEIPYVYELPAGDSQYSVRVKGISSTTNESKWATLAFRSLPENLFSNYDIVMSALGEITISWTPGKMVTKMKFISESGELTEDISEDEMAAGTKTFTDLPNDFYTINLLNGEKVRGFQDYAMEGDVLLSSGADITAAITAAAPGDVIVLEAGGDYPFIGEYEIAKSIKVKALDGVKPTLYLTEGNRMFVIGSGLSPADSIVFEKLHFDGYYNLDENTGQIRGIFDQEGESCNIGKIKFQSCQMYNLGRQVIRLRGGDDQTIGEFSIDDCVINNLGGGSGSYGVFCATETNTNATIVKITNTTLSEFACHFIRYDDAISCESIIVENCTFNKVPFASGRYLMDIRNAVITEGVEVTNCIFGNTTYGDDPSISGIRAADDVTLAISNTYVTTDFFNSGYSIVELCIDLGASSTQLWTDPENNDYTFLMEGIEAGDPRWY